jgi:hypothetical protein
MTVLEEITTGPFSDEEARSSPPILEIFPSHTIPRDTDAGLEFNRAMEIRLVGTHLTYRMGSKPTSRFPFEEGKTMWARR